MKTCSETVLCLWFLQYFLSLETKMILQIPNETFLRITRYRVWLSCDCKALLIHKSACPSVFPSAGSHKVVWEHLMPCIGLSFTSFPRQPLRPFVCLYEDKREMRIYANFVNALALSKMATIHIHIALFIMHNGNNQV